LNISVVDNSLGIEKKQLLEIKEKLNGKEDYTEHIGLFNTNKRLKLIFGELNSLRIRSKFGLGTAIYIRIPINEDLE
jgi:two-component system, sensor histidine kinase YesM